MPNLNPKDARTYNGTPASIKYDPQYNQLWIKLTNGTNTAWVKINLADFPTSVDHTGAA
jgi:hypothetical protein